MLRLSRVWWAALAFLMLWFACVQLIAGGVLLGPFDGIAVTEPGWKVVASIPPTLLFFGGLPLTAVLGLVALIRQGILIGRWWRPPHPTRRNRDEERHSLIRRAAIYDVTAATSLILPSTPATVASREPLVPRQE